MVILLERPEAVHRGQHFNESLGMPEPPPGTRLFELGHKRFAQRLSCYDQTVRRG
jgi:hypothetical protein